MQNHQTLVKKFHLIVPLSDDRLFSLITKFFETMSHQNPTPKQKKHYTFTFYQATLKPPPPIVLKFTPSAAPPPQRLTFTAKKQSSSSQPKKPPPTGLAKVLNDIWKKVSQKDTQKIFAYPVTEDIAPGYFNVVKHPIDLSVIRAKIHDDEYQTLQQFRDDMRLMFTNCLTYNPKTTFVYQQGEMLFQFFRRQMKLAKKQMLGSSQQTTSSMSRNLSGNAQRKRHTINSLSVPVVFESESKEQGEMPSFPQTKDFGLFYVPNPPPKEENDSQARLDSLCDVIRITPHLQNDLKLLKDSFPNYVLVDALKHIAGVDSGFDSNSLDIDSVLQEQTKEPKEGSLGVSVAPVPNNFLDELAKQMPELPLECIRPNSSSVDDLKAQNLRLMLFYYNSLQYWRGSDLNHGKTKILDTINQNITKITMGITPGTLIKTPEHNILQHIFFSTIPQ